MCFPMCLQVTSLRAPPHQSSSTSEFARYLPRRSFADADGEALYPKLQSTMANVFTEIKTPAQLSDGSCFEGSLTFQALLQQRK
jgi:hypothetical protein